MAKLASILKQHNVDRVIGYHELPPDKDGKILFGWQEKNELPLNEQLVLSRQFGDGMPDTVVLATRKDYLTYFDHLVGVLPAEYISKSDRLKSDFKMNNQFIMDIALFLTTGIKFIWDSKVEYQIIAEIID